MEHLYSRSLKLLYLKNITVGLENSENLIQELYTFELTQFVPLEQ